MFTFLINLFQKKTKTNKTHIIVVHERPKLKIHITERKSDPVYETKKTDRHLSAHLAGIRVRRAA